MKFLGVLLLWSGVLAGYGDEVILREDFSSGMKNWYAEGGRSVEVRDGRLLVDADPEKIIKDGSSGHFCTVWNRIRISGDVRVEFDVCVENSVTGTNNINFFLFYTMPDGSSPEKSQAARKFAEYRDYHPLNGYIFTFLNAPENRTAARIRIRRCPGFRLLRETYAYHNRGGQVYRVGIVKRGKQLDFSLDGRLQLSARDDQPLNEGYFGFRTYRTRLWFDNLSITRLTGPTPNGQQ